MNILISTRMLGDELANELTWYGATTSNAPCVDVCNKWLFVTERKLKKEVLFNGALNTFYFWLYGVRHMVKDHSDSERENPISPLELLFPISSKGYFICIIPHTG